MHYGETKKVRARNGDQFVADFKKVRTIVVSPYITGGSFTTSKLDVWHMAKDYTINYQMTNKVFKNGRLVMQIL